jgi:hypothetical protein
MRRRTAFSIDPMCAFDSRCSIRGAPYVIPCRSNPKRPPGIGGTALPAV